jgi:hypothetical protein
MKQFNYGTVTDAINKFRQQGFNIDFNLKDNLLPRHIEELEAQKFRVVAIYRYEGDSDPADEAIVYAIESLSGLKGTLVTGYGMYTDAISTQILRKLHNEQFRN